MPGVVGVRSWTTGQGWSNTEASRGSSLNRHSRILAETRRGGPTKDDTGAQGPASGKEGLGEPGSSLKGESSCRHVVPNSAPCPPGDQPQRSDCEKQTHGRHSHLYPRGAGSWGVITPAPPGQLLSQLTGREGFLPRCKSDMTNNILY